MNRKNLFLTILLMGIIKIACGQISKEQYNAISKEVKIFDYNPTYQLRFTAINCTYEVYVNDMLASFSFTTGNSAGEQHVDIPQYILTSGPQQIKVKVYPKAIEDGKLAGSLGTGSTFAGRIVHGQYEVTDFDSFTEVINFKIPPSVGKPGAEINLSFSAKVPYNLKGWTGGMNLSKEDKARLMKEALGVYERFATAYKNKNIEAVASMIYNREKEVAQAFFFKSGEAKSYDHGWENLSDEAKSLESIKVVTGAELRYFAGGQVVALLIPNGEDRDFPAIQAETNEGYTYYALYLYRPNAGAPLEIIR